MKGQALIFPPEAGGGWIDEWFVEARHAPPREGAVNVFPPPNRYRKKSCFKGRAREGYSMKNEELGMRNEYSGTNY